MKLLHFLKIAVFLLALFLISCDDEPIQPTKIKTFTFSPDSGSVGQQIVLTGSIFDADFKNLEIFFNNQSTTPDSAPIKDGIQEIYVKVPDKATTGKITIKTGEGLFESKKEFTVNPPPETQILAINVVERFLEIEFNYLKLPAALNVYWQPNIHTPILPLQFDTVTTKLVRCKLPENVYSGLLTVSLNNKIILDDKKIEIKPIIKSFSPSSAYPGEIIKINGQWFSNELIKVYSVFFDNDTAKVLSVKPNEINVKVPKGAEYRKVSVYVAGVIGRSDVDFQTIRYEIEPLEFTYCKIQFYSPKAEFKSFDTKSGPSTTIGPITLDFENCPDFFAYFPATLSYNNTCTKTIFGRSYFDTYEITRVSQGIDFVISDQKIDRFEFSYDYYYNNPIYVSNRPTETKKAKVHFVAENIPIISYQGTKVIAEIRGEVLKEFIKVISHYSMFETTGCNTCSTKTTNLNSITYSAESFIRIELD